MPHNDLITYILKPLCYNVWTDDCPPKGEIMNGKRLFAASYGHFSIDILNSSIPIILTAVATNFNLDVSQIGLAAMIYTFAASLTQPLFGFLVDKVRGRWIAGIGLAWTMSFYAAAPFMPSYPLLVACLTLGALGSGAFHPAGMVNATMAGGAKPTTATSLFFVGGQSGLAIGPWPPARRREARPRAHRVRLPTCASARRTLLQARRAHARDHGRARRGASRVRMGAQQGVREPGPPRRPRQPGPLRGASAQLAASGGRGGLVCPRAGGQGPPAEGVCWWSGSHGAPTTSCPRTDSAGRPRGATPLPTLLPSWRARSASAGPWTTRRSPSASSVRTVGSCR